MRKIAIVPTLLTLGNGVCGFVAITLASKVLPTGVDDETEKYFLIAGLFIIGAMVFDMLDGYVARLSKTASKFGGELDSLCDAISFGVAPAFLILKMGPGWEPRPIVHQIVAGIAALYMVCTILRLARFNVDNTPDPAAHKRFRGLPSPGAAGCIASLAILRGGVPNKLADYWGLAILQETRTALEQFVEIAAPLGGLVVALLMVSIVPYPHITKQWLRGRQHVWHLIQICIGVFIVLLMREIALVLVFWGYALGLPIRHLIVKHLLKDPTMTPRLDDVLPR